LSGNRSNIQSLPTRRSSDLGKAKIRWVIKAEKKGSLERGAALSGKERKRFIFAFPALFLFHNHQAYSGGDAQRCHADGRDGWCCSWLHSSELQSRENLVCRL